MHHKRKALLGVCGLVLSWTAHAEIFICKDAGGHTLTSDRPIAECADRDVRVLGKNGLTERVIEAPLTAEQKRQKQAAEDKRRADLAAQQEQRRQDRALLARYRNEGEIELARTRTLDQVKEQSRREELNIAESEKRLKEARAEADFHKGKTTLPALLQRRIDDAEQAIQDSRQRLAERTADMAQINAKFDQALARYRELNGGVMQTSVTTSRK